MTFRCTRRITYIGSAAQDVRTRLAMRSVSSHRKTRDHCVHWSVLSVVGSFGKKHKASLTTSRRRLATSGAGDNRESRNERSSRDCREIRRMGAARPRTAMAGGVFGMLHRTTVLRAGLIEGTAEQSAVRNEQRSRQLRPRSAQTKTAERFYVQPLLILTYCRIVRLRLIVS